MSKKYRLALWLLAVIYVVYHLATLIYSPLPWFDEITFLSMTESYMKDGTLFEKVRILGEPAEKLNYGPIYFVWQAFMIKTFGYGIFTVRITNMLFGFLSLFLLYKTALKLRLRNELAIAAVVFTAIEPNFNQFLHSGRMDFIGLSFFFLAYLSFRSSENKSRTTSYFFLAITGVLLCSSILTNPRFVYAFPVFIAYFLYEMIALGGPDRLKAFMKYVIIGVSFALVYYLWVYLTFGGITEYIDFTRKAAYLKDHLGMGTHFRIRYNLFIFLFSFIVVGYFGIKDRFKTDGHLALFTVPAIASFVAIVNGGVEGRYFTLAIPFVALLLVGFSFQLLENRAFKYATGAIALMFAGVFVFKAAYIVSTIPQHDPVRNEKRISPYLESNSSVFGDFEFYYIARKKNCSYLTTQMNGSVPELTEYILSNKIQYVMLKKGSDMKQYYEPAFLNDHYQLIATIEDESYSNFFGTIINRLPYKISDSYSCYIYKFKG